MPRATERVEKGAPVSRELDEALQHASSIGGARPKAQIQDGNVKFVAKFSKTDRRLLATRQFPNPYSLESTKLEGMKVSP